MIFERNDSDEKQSSVLTSANEKSSGDFLSAKKSKGAKNIISHYYPNKNDRNNSVAFSLVIRTRGNTLGIGHLDDNFSSNATELDLVQAYKDNVDLSLKIKSAEKNASDHQS